MERDRECSETVKSIHLGFKEDMDNAFHAVYVMN